MTLLRWLSIFALLVLASCAEQAAGPQPAAALELPALTLDGTVRGTPAGAVVLAGSDGSSFLLPRNVKLRDGELVPGSAVSVELPAGRAEVLALTSTSAVIRTGDDIFEVPLDRLRAGAVGATQVRLMTPAGETVQLVLADAISRTISERSVLVSPSVLELGTLQFPARASFLPVRLVDRLDDERLLLIAAEDGETVLRLVPLGTLASSLREDASGVFLAVERPQGIQLVSWQPGLFLLEPVTFQAPIMESRQQVLVLDGPGDELLLVPRSFATVSGQTARVRIPAELALPLAVSSEVLTLHLSPQVGGTPFIVQLPLETLPGALLQQVVVNALDSDDDEVFLTLSEAARRADDDRSVLSMLDPTASASFLVRALPAAETLAVPLGRRGKDAAFLTPDDPGRILVIPASTARGNTGTASEPVVFSPGKSGMTIVSFTPGHRRQADKKAGREEDKAVREAEKAQRKDDRAARKDEGADRSGPGGGFQRPPDRAAAPEQRPAPPRAEPQGPPERPKERSGARGSGQQPPQPPSQRGRGGERRSSMGSGPGQGGGSGDRGGQGRGSENQGGQGGGSGNQGGQGGKGKGG
ncbi:MAG: hypothetical protein HY319_18980 [Armatimonadetes bacterium]|nr:hypothetical protein [Armatimonadota bacterium]